jgi:ribosomal protein S27E
MIFSLRFNKERGHFMRMKCPLFMMYAGCFSKS